MLHEGCSLSLLLQSIESFTVRLHTAHKQVRMAIHPLPLQEYQYRLGVDVGGTNTDAVIVDTTIQDQAKSVIATHKSPTTSPNVTEGIESAIISVLRKSNIDHDRIASLAIGTTHFINAIVEHDVRHLARVAVLRLSKSYTREIPPFSDFPPALRDTIRSYCGQIDGGLQIDGSLEAPIVESQVVRECAAIKERNLNAVVVSAVFSPLDNHFQQEQRVRDIIKREIPGAVVVCSSEIANLGFLERENASILNASINRFARRTIREFKMAMKRLNLRCGLYLTQNDGTLIDADTAARLPIRTFSSGPTNSMRGAAYLCGLSSDSAQNSSPTIVCDIGGTTSDVGVLLPSGFPRQALAGVSIAGVRVNYSLPQVESVGLGGGSIVRQDAGEVTVGRDSVGFAIKDKALVFGGDMMTATDIAVAAGTDSWIGQPSLVKTIHPELISKAQAVIKRHLEHTIDLVKTSPVPLTLILVGGGSIIAPGQLNGITSILRPPHHDVANAVGAAMARVGVTVDIIQNMANQTVAEAMQRAVDLALSRAALGGARAGTVTVAEQESLPLQYVEHQLRTVVKVIGDFSPLEPLLGELNASDHEDAPYQTTATQPASVEQRPNGHLDILTYRPKIVKNSKTGIQEWIVSSVDLEWLADGCYVLGCGGGGSPYPEMLKLRQHLEEGHDLRIMDAEDLRPESRIYCKVGTSEG
jgi:N-methylhydantoinase A/oxoprolinase/acetone carboxylase beta subunit